MRVKHITAVGGSALATATKPRISNARLDQWLARTRADPDWRAKLTARSHEANETLRAMGLLADK